MILGVPKETYPGEHRVAITPAVLGLLKKAGLDVIVESGAGLAAGFTDEQYRSGGATVVDDRSKVFADAQVIAQVMSYGANPENGSADLDLLRPSHVLIGHGEPLLAHDQTKALSKRGVSFLAMELIPRITRAQSMDALSSQANLAGYKAVILAAEALAKVFPMMMTAAGTVKPAKVFVIGAGVAGLQAIATAKRLGAVVNATDVRAATKEQVESLGGKFVFLEELLAEGEGGYAKELTDQQKQKQQEMIAKVIAESDVVITTAAIPGRKSPVLIDADVVQQMAPQSVIVDMAAERGGNCALTEPGKVIKTENGVTIIGTINIPSTIAHDASQTYARNILALLNHLVVDGKIELDMSDEITAGTLVCREGEILHPRVRELMGLEPLPSTEEEPAKGADES